MTYDPRQQPRTLVDCLVNSAHAQAGRVAFRYLADGEEETSSLTYKQLFEVCMNLAAALSTKAEAGDRVVLLCSGIEFPSAFFAVLCANMVAVPVNPQITRRSWLALRMILLDAEARTIIATQQTRSLVESYLKDDPLGETLKWICFEDVVGHDRQNYTRIPIDENALAFLQYTSGSTGTPKGVMVTHANLMANQKQIAHFTHSSSQSIFVNWLPAFHDMGLIGNILHTVYAGCEAVLIPPVSFIQKPLRWLQAITRYKGTISGAPNFAYKIAAQKIKISDKQGLDLSTWKFAFNGAEPVHASTLENFASYFKDCGMDSAALSPCYGMAEATLMISSSEPAEPYRVADVVVDEFQKGVIKIADRPSVQTKRLVSSGQICPGIELQIVDPNLKKQVDPNRIGEIWVRGANIAQGYWKRSELTQEQFCATLNDHPESVFFRTGDLGFILNGQVFISGRLKDLIIIRGKNHYPQDIELCSEQSHISLQTAGCAAFSLDSERGEHLVVLQEIKKEDRSSIDFEQISQAIRAAIAQNHGLNVDTLVLLRPGSVLKTSSGKVRRQACKKAFLEGTLSPLKVLTSQSSNPETAVLDQVDESHSPQNIELLLRSAILSRKKLQATDLAGDQEFSSFGLDSVDLIEMAGELSQYLKRPVDPALFFNYPTVVQLSEHLGTSEEPAEKNAVLVSSQDHLSHSIAVIGVSCRFPGARNKAEFWHMLAQGGIGISEVPPDRWDIEEYYDPNLSHRNTMNTKWGGFLQDIDKFDASFFGLSAAEASGMDPQQRLLLELSWEALEDSGITADRIKGTETGIFVGMSSVDFLTGLKHTPNRAGTGVSNSIGSSRLSYWYDTHGPSIVVDTACSSSLVALHLASQSLRNGEATLALAGGVNLVLSPKVSMVLSHAGMLAPDGLCKSFDEHANGYVRSEGCGFVVLKKLDDARRDGDRILAVIEGSAVNHNGRANGLTAPNGLSQEKLLRRALADAHIAAHKIDYIEAHGSGTALGDAVEVRALQNVFKHSDESDEKIYSLGSVKANIGHLEAAAGIAGFIKAVLALQFRTIPPQPVRTDFSPQKGLEGTPFRIPTLRSPALGQPHYAGVSSFGFGGTNAHIVLRAYDQFADDDQSPDMPQQLLLLSSKTDAGLRELAAAYQFHLQQTDGPSLQEICYTAARGRVHYDRRLSIVATTRHEALENIKAYLSATASPDLFQSSPMSATAVGINLVHATGSLLYLAVFMNASHEGFQQRVCEIDDFLAQQFGQPFFQALFQRYASQGIQAEQLDTKSLALVNFLVTTSLLDFFKDIGAAFAKVESAEFGELLQLYTKGEVSYIEAWTRLLSQHQLVKADLATGGRHRASSPISNLEGQIFDFYIGPDIRQMARSIARLYVLDRNTAWNKVYPRKLEVIVDVPHYQFQRKRHWPSSDEIEYPLREKQ